MLLIQKLCFVLTERKTLRLTHKWYSEGKSVRGNSSKSFRKSLWFAALNRKTKTSGNFQSLLKPILPDRP